MQDRQNKTIVRMWFRFTLILSFSLIFSVDLGDLRNFPLVNLQPLLADASKVDSKKVAINSNNLRLSAINESQKVRDLQDSFNVLGDLKKLWESKLEDSPQSALGLKQIGEIYISLAMTNYRHAKSSIFIGDEQEAGQLKKLALEYDYNALNYLQESINLARINNDKLTEIKALFYSISVAQRLGIETIRKVDMQEAIALFNQFPDSSKKVYLAIELAQLIQVFPDDSISPLAQCPKGKTELKTEIILKQAIKIARKINDIKALSFALGSLGHFYECQNDYKQALRLTEQALLEYPKNSTAYKDWEQSLYLWHWQIGRILKAEKNTVAAIKAYERAITKLTFTDDYLNLNRNIYKIGSNNGNTYELIYRELLGLRIQRILENPHEKQQQLNATINTLDSLKQLELGNYFSQSYFYENFAIKSSSNNDYSANDYPRKVENRYTSNNLYNLSLRQELKPELKSELKSKLNDSSTAIFTSIIFPKKIIIIVSLPNGEKRYDVIEIESENLRQQIKEFRVGLEDRGNPTYYPKQGEILYNWIIRSFEAELERKHIKTLVFVQDGILRSIPMAALHDGKHFLMENTRSQIP
ncbi:MAG: CHAT domain-containing protein [Methylacidiphilales bacterium]|nr:CHAT domain-containing protein [Candidatus Methylacidiphilales bacterium]